MLEKMDLLLLKTNDLLFLEKGKVYVIVSGYMLMKNHENCIWLPASCAKFGEGDILNFNQNKIPMFRTLESWLFAQVETEIAVFDRQYFEQLWEEEIMTPLLKL